jgi:hypothetical protein
MRYLLREDLGIHIFYIGLTGLEPVYGADGASQMESTGLHR